MTDPGEDPPPLFLDQTETRRAKKIFWGYRPPLPPTPLSKDLDDRLLISRSGSGTGNGSLLQLLTREITLVEGIVLQLIIFQNCFFIRANFKWVMPEK